MYDKLQDVKADLDLINQRLGLDSIVILSGCNTGKDPHGKTLLQQMLIILTKATVIVMAGASLAMTEMANKCHCRN